MDELLLFTDLPTPRVRYVLEVIFGRLLTCSYRLTTDRQEFQNSTAPRINYSSRRLTDAEVFLPAGPLLAERDIRPFVPDAFDCEGKPALFRQVNSGSDLPFDLPAMFFFLLSRYEEYLPYTPDNHGRFPAAQCLAYRQGFLREPVLNQWSLALAELIRRRFPRWSPPFPAYRFLPTYDIDLAWAFRYRGLRRQVGGVVRDVLRGQFPALSIRFAVWLGRREDPFFTFAYLENLHRQYHLKPCYFFLLGDPGPRDPNPSPRHRALHRLIRSLQAQHDLGLHPSYRSNEEPRRLAQEAERLRRITGSPVTASRQHFLRLHLPDTYRRLLEAGIRADYSMGYADEPGFRAGVATPFPWYDLSREAPTDLLVHPFQVMDVTLKQYLGLSPEQALDTVRPMIQATRRCGGTFSTLWHNSSFSFLGGWEGWSPVFEAIIREAV